MPRVLFILHGMGDHLPGWSRPHVALLDELLAGFPGAKGSTTPFSDRVHVEEITYDAVFDHHVLTWGQQASALEQFGIEHAIGLPKTLSLLSGSTLDHDTRKFVWETLLDPVFYRGAPIVRNQVRATVVAQLLEKWGWYLKEQKHHVEPLEVSFLCHSLGTIVTSDVLAHVGEDRDGKSDAFSAAKQRVHLLCTLANVTRLGPRRLVDIDPMTTVVRPTTAKKVGGFPRNYLSNYLNVRHRYDPFCWWQRFAPTGWKDGYELIDDLDHFHFAFPHDYLHYLKHPSTHIALFRKLFGDEAVSAAAEKKARDAFDKVPVPAACTTAIDALKAELDGLRDAVDDSGSLDDVVAGAVRTYEAARAAVASCRQLPLTGDAP